MTSHRHRIDAAVIEALADSEAALRARVRVERAMLLDLISQQRAELARLRSQLDAAREELRRYTARAVEAAA